MVGRVGRSRESDRARGLSMGRGVKAVPKRAGRLGANGQGCRIGKWFIEHSTPLGTMQQDAETVPEHQEEPPVGKCLQLWLPGNKKESVGRI